MRPVSPKPTQVKFRAARKGEQKPLARMALAAFRMGVLSNWERYYLEHPHRRVSDTRVAMVGARMAGHATALRFTMSLGGVDLPVAGIAAVAVPPEFRQEGVADALMRETLRHVSGRKVPLSMLYAFRESYYRKFGYGDIENTEVVRVTPAQLPFSDSRRNVRSATAKDRTALQKLYEQLRAGTTGQLKRTAWWWKLRVFARATEQLVYVDPKTGRVTGYLLYDVPERPQFPNQHCQVIELRALDGAGYRGLLGSLHALGDQFDSIELSLPPGDSLFTLVRRGVVGVPPEVSHLGAAGLLGGGAMLRIVRLADALAAHPGPARSGVRATLGLDLEDPVFDAQCGAFDLRLGPEGALLKKGKRARQRLALSIDRLSQVYSGAVSARRLLATGFIEGSEEAAAHLDEACAGPAPYLGPGNGF